MSFGMPGVGGSLGQCCYCGDTFMGEILFGTTCQSISIGGQEMFIHIKHEDDAPSRDCFTKLVAIVRDDKLLPEQWAELPEGSPLGLAMKKLQWSHASSRVET